MVHWPWLVSSYSSYCQITNHGLYYMYEDCLSSFGTWLLLHHMPWLVWCVVYMTPTKVSLLDPMVSGLVGGCWDAQTFSALSAYWCPSHLYWCVLICPLICFDAISFLLFIYVVFIFLSCDSGLFACHFWSLVTFSLLAVRNTDARRNEQSLVHSSSLRLLCFSQVSHSTSIHSQW